MKKYLLVLLIILSLCIVAFAGIPTKDTLETMDYVFQAQPFINVPAKDSIDLTTMDYAFQAQPFVSPVSVGEVTTNILFIFQNF